MLEIPVLRKGQPYKSLETYTLYDKQSSEPICDVSMANRGLIAKDLAEYPQNRKSLDEITIADSIQMCKEAATYFASAELPLGEQSQSRADYIKYLSMTSGLPETLCASNMKKIEGALNQMETVLAGMIRSKSLTFLDNNNQFVENQSINFIREADSLGVVAPNNSPGVHTLWLPAIPLKVGLCIRPGSNEPWTTYRIIQSFIKAGMPEQVFGYYPSDYSGSTEVVLRSDRSMVFGDKSSVEQWRQDPRVQLHGPGWSKIIFGSDSVNDWEKYLDFIETSVAANSGRSCINVSSIWVPSHGREIANALAERLLKIQPLPLTHPQAELAAFADKNVARGISNLIDSHLHNSEAIDISRELRQTDRVAERDGWTYLQPTVIYSESVNHPLANTEFIFPFVSVVEVPQEEILDQIGYTLVASIVTQDEMFIQQSLNFRQIDRLNIGPIPSNSILYDQPHEGNLFDHLYKQRAFQMVS
jgi:acyl-CoA reductase-like NAD-dependent aldehyde dehydrogenase